MKKQLLLPLVLATVLASCSKSEMEVPTAPATPDHTAPITLSAGVEASTTPMSRAVGEDFPADKQDVFCVTAFAGSGDPIPYFFNEKVNSGVASDLSFVNPQYYPADGRKLFFYAYAPASTTVSPGAYTAEYTINGSTDIMWAKDNRGIAKASTGTQSQPHFTFAHMLKRLQFVVKHDATFEQGIKVTYIELKKQQIKATLNYVKGTLTFTDAATSNMGVYNNTQGIEITTAGNAIPGSIMCQPGATFTVDIATGSVVYNDVKITLTDTGTGTVPTAGMSYTVTLTFKRGAITPTATIGTWSTANVDAPSQILPPAKMTYGGVNGTNIGTGTGLAYALSGSTRSSYNGFNGLVSAKTNGAYYTSTTVLYPTEKVHHNLEVALADEILNGSTLITWNEARTACANKTTYGGGWRLPRFSELQLMYLNKASLQKVPGFVAFGDGYYSNTEYSINQVWIKFFNSAPNSNSNSLTGHTSGGQRARCVREVPATPAKMYYGDANNNGGTTQITAGGTTYILKGSTTASYNNYPTSNKFNSYAEAVTTEKVYHKLEVANAYELNPATGSNLMDLDTAVRLCKAKSTDGGGWRLPRTSELHLMYMNKASLEQTPEFDAFLTTGGYNDIAYTCSATEYSYTNLYTYYWCIGFKNGTATGLIYNEGRYVRCVREL